MIAPNSLPAEWLAWNGLTGAPFQGPYSFYFGNCETRIWEYPWAYSAGRVRAGMKAIDVGGGLSGFAITLAAAGLDVTILDPKMGARYPGRLVEAWARMWGQEVRFLETHADEAPLPPSSLDVAFCLSVIEHIETPEERARLFRGVHRLLRPGGRFVVTLDLMLDLYPFTDRPSKPDAQNVSLLEILGAAPFRLLEGDPKELYGLPEFDARRILSRAREGEYLMAHNSLLIQCFVLQAEVAL